MTTAPPLPVQDSPAMTAFRAELAALVRQAIASGLPRRDVLLATQHEGWRIASGDRG